MINNKVEILRDHVTDLEIKAIIMITKIKQKKSKSTIIKRDKAILTTSKKTLSVGNIIKYDIAKIIAQKKPKKPNTQMFIAKANKTTEFDNHDVFFQANIAIKFLNNIKAIIEKI